MIKKLSLSALAAVGLLFVGLQLLPGGVTHPPVTAEPAWDSPQTEALARRACFDCHSNETVVPWYGNLAPFRQLVADHVNEGRAEMNLSEMDRPQEEAHEAGEAVAEGEMPPAYYVLLHPEARLSPAEKRQLIDGLNATLGGEGGEREARSGRRRGRHDDDDDDD